MQDPPAQDPDGIFDCAPVEEAAETEEHGMTRASSRGPGPGRAWAQPRPRASDSPGLGGFSHNVV